MHGYRRRYDALARLVVANVGKGLTIQPRHPYCDACCKRDGAQRTVRRKGNVIRLRERSNAYEFGDPTTVGNLEL